MIDPIVKFIVTRNFKEGDENLFELTVSVVMYNPIILHFNVFANRISDDVKRVQHVFTIDSFRDLIPTVGIHYYAVHVVEHVFGELFNGTTRYNFNALKEYHEEFGKFMQEVTQNLENTIDELTSPFNKNKC